MGVRLINNISTTHGFSAHGGFIDIAIGYVPNEIVEGESVDTAFNCSGGWKLVTLPETIPPVLREPQVVRNLVHCDGGWLPSIPYHDGVMGIDEPTVVNSDIRCSGGWLPL